MNVKLISYSQDLEGRSLLEQVAYAARECACAIASVFPMIGEFISE